MAPSHPHRRPSQLRGPRPRPAYRAARAFYLTLLIGTCFAAYALFIVSPLAPSPSPQQHIFKRSSDAPSTFSNDDEQCRLVHRATDKCAFVHTQCPNEEAGFSAYLDLYYCRLAEAKALAFAILIAWLGLLFSTIGIAASDFFCINLSTIATILGMSESMAGVTFLAFGNGSPDVFSTFAAMSTNSGSLAVGELFGAAGFITAVVSGSMALIRPFHVARKSFVRDVGFFVVAAAFSVAFLWDGKLHLWECLAMVGYYIFYVAFVVAWHWWLSRRRRKREKEAAARGHYLPPDDELEAEEEPYRDDPDESAPRPTITRGVSREDWSALERGGDSTPYHDQPDEDDEEEARDRWMSELNSNMRLTRPSVRHRSNTTLTPVRPSLVGALEFQAVLKSLQKSRNIQTYPMDARRYSDDPAFTTVQQQEHMSSTSDPASRPPYQFAADGLSTEHRQADNLEVPYSAPALARGRAASVGSMPWLKVDDDIHQLAGQDGANADSVQNDDLINLDADASTTSQHNHHPESSRLAPPSPSIEFSPATPRRENTMDSIKTTNTGSTKSARFSQYLELPGDGGTSYHSGIDQRQFDDDPGMPRRVPSTNQLPKIMIPRADRSSASTPMASPFPRSPSSMSSRSQSRPQSLFLPPPSIGSPDQTGEVTILKRPSFLDRWWLGLLPPPGVIISTLFPTIYHWHEKNYWEKALGIVAAPSVFLLTITLPVVESGKDDEDGPKKDNSFDSAHSKRQSVSLNHGGVAGTGSSATVAVDTERSHHHNAGGVTAVTPTPINNNISSTPITAEPVQQTSPPQPRPGSDLWNRWLLIIQLFLAPIFVVLSIYMQSPIDITPYWLVKPTLIALLVSLILLVPVLLTTTPTHRPPVYRYILSSAGFIVSIAWISTVASQVVGALKALAVILNMSHAIMGLTIFAVGNSLGDLVADVTVARLGYPVMALSACFGGPMLNILLGIGLSGSYILIVAANKRMKKHPDKEMKFHAYHIEVGNTLIVSGATLLLTLVGLLIFVPMNKWVMSKRLGWALIAVWTLSTIVNVVLEVTGWADGPKEGFMM